MRKYEVVVLSMGAFARTLRIYSPKNADRAIIMHDGQNAFYDSDASFGKSWRMLDCLKSQNIKNTAIIGIDSTPTRDYDYMPFPSELEEYGMKTMGGGAKLYADFIDSIVIPYLNNRFGFKRYAMLGSSAGALITLYFAARQNTQVSAYGTFSTPLFVSPKAFNDFFINSSFSPESYYQIYTGGNECTDEINHPELMKDMFVSDACVLIQQLRKHGCKNVSLSIDANGTHEEPCWRESAARFAKMFANQQD